MLFPAVDGGGGSEVEEVSDAAEGVTARMSFSSTDANVPMSLGIPAITIARAATGGRGHSPDEWIDVSAPESLKVKRMDLVALLAAAGYR